MDAIIIGVTLAGSFTAAFLLQKAALEAFFRALTADRRARQSLAFARTGPGILELGLPDLVFGALGFADNERAAPQVFCLIEFIFCHTFPNCSVKSHRVNRVTL